MMKWIVFFDGECGLCSRSVRFFASADHRDRLRFAPLQGETAAARQLTAHADAEEGSMVVWREADGTSFLRSDAVLEMAHALGGFWRLLHLLRIFPRSWREALYRHVARNRIRWFGRADVCALPNEALRSRLLP
jgi:predicted DCC family thiol-disulfide oxidoreductase YuxK